MQPSNNAGSDDVKKKNAHFFGTQKNYGYWTVVEKKNNDIFQTYLVLW